MLEQNSQQATYVVGSDDTHKNLHVAAVVDEHDKALGCKSFPTPQQGYRQMLHWQLDTNRLLSCC